MIARNGFLVLAAATSAILIAPAGAQEAPASPDQPMTGPANPLAGVPISDVKSFVDRPLFTASRRKAIVAPPVASVAPPPRPAPPSAANLRLLGTIATSAGVSALIQDTARGTTQTVADGKTIDRWRVAEIQASKVKLESEGQSVWLEIFGPAASPGAAPAAATPPAATVRSSAAQPNGSIPQPAPLAPAPPLAPGAAPPGTVAGTAAADAAARSPYRLTFGTDAPQNAE